MESTGILLPNQKVLVVLHGRNDVNQLEMSENNLCLVVRTESKINRIRVYFTSINEYSRKTRPYSDKTKFSRLMFTFSLKSHRTMY